MRISDLEMISEHVGCCISSDTRSNNADSRLVSSMLLGKWYGHGCHRYPKSKHLQEPSGQNHQRESRKLDGLAHEFKHAATSRFGSHMFKHKAAELLRSRCTLSRFHFGRTSGRSVGPRAVADAFFGSGGSRTGATVGDRYMAWHGVERC